MPNPDIPELPMRPIRPSGPIPDPPKLLALKPKACVQCKTRKVKCDRETPCGNCIRWSLDCVFPSPIRKCRRPRKAAARASPGVDGPPSDGSSQAIPPDVILKLEATLQSITQLLKEHGAKVPARYNPAQTVSSGGLHPPAASTSWDDLQRNLAVVSELTTKLGSSPVATPVVPGTPNLLSGLSSALGILNYPCPQPFPFDTFNLDVSPFHPSQLQIHNTWKAFLTNIDPLVKVLHRSTTERILHKVVRDSASLTAAETAIVFTVYFSSLSALSDEDAQVYFGIPKQAAQSTFKSAAEHALAKTNVHARTDLTSLQAFVLFLSLGRFTDHAPRVWALTGLVHRLEAVSKSEGGSPFEVEIRRRLRWELWCLDHRAHEDSGRGSAPTDTGGAPELPLNVCDADLVPSSTEIPNQKPGWTEISFSLVRFDIARTARTIGYMHSAPQKLALVDACERRVQSTYLRYCDGSEPVHWLAKHVAHVLLMELRFKLHPRDRHSSTSAGDCDEQRTLAESDGLFLKAIDIVDTPRRVAVEPQAKRWSWLLQGYMQFWPLSHLLRELRYRHNSEVVERGWDVAERALARRGEDDTSENVRTLRRLMEEARLEKSYRMAAAQGATTFIPLGQSQLVHPGSDFFAEPLTPNLPENSLDGIIAEPGPALARDDFLGQGSAQDPFLAAGYDAIGWDGIHLPGTGPTELSNFVFDGGVPVLDPDPAVDPSLFDYGELETTW